MNINCGEHPVAYERVSAHYDWILKHTKDATYCKNQAWDGIIEDPLNTNGITSLSTIKSIKNTINSIENTTKSIKNTKFAETTLADDNSHSSAHNNYESYFTSKNLFLYFFITYNN